MSHHHLSALGLHLGLVAPIVGHRHLRVHGFDSSREQKKMGWFLREESTAGGLSFSTSAVWQLRENRLHPWLWHLSALRQSAECCLHFPGPVP